METSPLCLHNSPPLGTANSRICSKDTSGSEGFWRPWILTPKDAERKRVQKVELHSPSEATEDSVKLAQYTHPVRKKNAVQFQAGRKALEIKWRLIDEQNQHHHYSHLPLSPYDYNFVACILRFILFT
ncbi:protein ripply2 isoform X2 [Pseudonaja textilis]|uniref:protein ripply2 isoform X2 n=1 Tax=Pseudonaja textilis TaxID=8673 RepID=UPI000EA8EB19|nr:protein ripply2 isoform X2 [Pseudonaja textilis]